MIAETDPRLFVEECYRRFPPPYGGPPTAAGAPDDGCTTFMEDHMSIVKIIRNFQVRSILEIGTNRGYTALLMSQCPTVQRVKTIDVWDSAGDLVRGQPNIEFACCSSFCFPVDGEIGRYDMVLIDAIHEAIPVAADTRMAMILEPRLIAWHDYWQDEKNPDPWPGVKQAVDYLAGHWGLKVTPMQKIVAFVDTQNQ